MEELARYRDEFPVAERFIYLNHASTGPLPRRAAAAIERLTRDQMLGGSVGWKDWIETYAGFRTAAARLIGADSDEIAITKNTSEGLSFLANGLDWRSGDVAVGVEDDFPANYFPWRRLERRGVAMRWIRMREGKLDLDEVDRACRGARLLALSFVHFLSGFRVDLDAAGEICRRRGCLFVVDAVQGLGPFPVDVKRSGVHALSSAGHKWLLGPEGSAFLYVDRELVGSLDPVEFGWTNVTGYPEYSRAEDIRPDAGRFECGTLNTAGCYGLRASIELFLEVGVERIARRVDSLAARLVRAAAEKGYRPFTSRNERTGSGIVSLKKEGVGAEQVVADLDRRKVSVSARLGWIRASPHFYNTEEEIDRLVQLLP